MAALANAERGTIYLGIDDNGTTPGLSSDDVKRLNQLIGNTASQAVRSALTVQAKNIALPDGRVGDRVAGPEGPRQAVLRQNGVAWIKAGADKRRINSKEELRRLAPTIEQAPRTMRSLETSPRRVRVCPLPDRGRDHAPPRTADKPNMGLTSWSSGRVLKRDVATAKNYLDEAEVDTLNRITVMFLEQAEFRAQRRKDISGARQVPRG